jgi:hypothetical protein
VKAGGRRIPAGRDPPDKNHQTLRKATIMNTRALRDARFILAHRIAAVARYLLTGLAEAGLASGFVVPGDYNLPRASKTSRVEETDAAADEPR